MWRAGTPNLFNTTLFGTSVKRLKKEKKKKKKRCALKDDMEVPIGSYKRNMSQGVDLVCGLFRLLDPSY